MAEKGKNFDLIIKEDGVYLHVVNPEGEDRVTRAEVTEMIESYGVRELDFIVLSDVFKSREPELTVKISANPNVIQTNEAAAIEVTPDRMEAHIVFSEPINKGKVMSRQEIEDLILSEGVVIDPAQITSVLANKRYGRKMLISEGREPKKGADGFLQFHFDRSNLKPKPKIMEDGTVNFKQLGMIKLCNRGDILVTKVQPREGEDGVDVYGNILPAPPPKEAAAIPAGKGTAVSMDGLHLMADVSGQLLLQEGKINITPHLEIAEHVDNSTGDIEFNGQVTIRGNVVTGFTVKAVGNIEVFGVVEGAKLVSSDGNIVLGNGIQGAGKAELEAAGDVTAKFIEGSKVTSGGNIVADSIMKSHIKCDGSVTLAGKNGLLVGGTLVAGEKLVAQTIGSPMGTLTEIEVGGSPKELVRQKELIAEFGKLKIEYEKCDKAVATLTALRQKNQLPDDKKAILVKMINMKMVCRDKMTKLQEKIDEATRALAVSTGTVSVGRVMRPGVRVTIGNAQISIRDELSNCRLRNNGQKIVIGPNL